jgi:DNA-binding SARP family transcriptional activator
MNAMHISLFGKLRVECGDHCPIKFDAHRAQELFCYLLLYRSRLHDREKLATLLWGEGTSTRSRKYLRQTLWQIQSTLRDHDVGGDLLVVEDGWLGINLDHSLWLDVALFEDSYTVAEETAGGELSPTQARIVQEAVSLYAGDLLEGWYQDWCIYERDRYQEMYLILLDKLLGYCENHRLYEAGVMYGTQILHYDRAREQTHRRLMHLYHLSGQRTAALHQYEACVRALAEELGVEPAQSTLALCEKIRADQIEAPSAGPDGDFTSPGSSPIPTARVLSELGQIQTSLDVLQARVAQLRQLFDETQPPRT